MSEVEKKLLRVIKILKSIRYLGEEDQDTIEDIIRRLAAIVIPMVIKEELH